MHITRRFFDRASPRLPDALLGVLLFSLATVVGALYYLSFIKLEDRSRTPMRPPIVQIDTAVMVACGKGFARQPGPPPSLTRFIQMRVDSFDCADLPANRPPGKASGMAHKHRYSLYTIGLSWLVSGRVSWSGLAPLFGVFFGMVVALVYGLFRLGMGRVLATIGCVILTLSPFHLVHLPLFRDYSKAPFILALILIIGWIGTRRISNTALLVLSAVAGTMLGIGFGFRADMPIVMPPFFITLLFFVPGWTWARIRLKIVALLLFMGCFLLAGWPMVQRRAANNRLVHAALIGATEDRVSRIGLTSPLYSLGGDGPQKDRYIDTTVKANARRNHGPQPAIHYKQMSSEYYKAIIKHFPADMLLLGYASTLKILNLPFMNPTEYSSLPNTGIYLPDQHAPAGVDNSAIRAFYYRWTGMLTTLSGLSPLLVLITFLLVFARGSRPAALLLLCLLYFGSYPSIQFETRHVFHLEFISLWMLGFIVQQAARQIRLLAPYGQRRTWRERLSLPKAWWRPALRRVVAPALGLVLILLGPLYILRMVQKWHMNDVLQAYADANIAPLRVNTVSVNSHASLVAPPDSALQTTVGDPLHTEYLMAEFSTRRCDYSSVDFVVRYREPVAYLAGRPAYRFGLPLWDLSQRWTVHLSEEAQQTSRVFFPVYQMPSLGVEFGGLEMPSAQVDCLKGLYRIQDLDQLPLPTGFIINLPPDWKERPHYKVLTAWEAQENDVLNVHTVPRNLAVSKRQLEAPLRKLRATRPRVDAANVHIAEQGWRVKGKGEARFAPLLHINGLNPGEKGYLVVRGEMRRGSFALGLVEQEQWDGNILAVGKDRLTTNGFFERHRNILDFVRAEDRNIIETVVLPSMEEGSARRALYDQWKVVRVDEKGAFTLFFEVSGDDTYSLVLANALAFPTARQDFEIHEIGWMSP